MDNTALFLGTVGSVSLYRLADGTAEILWTSEIYGYGRYYVDTAPSANKLRHSVVGGSVRLDWTTGVLQSADGVQGPYGDVPNACPGYIYSGPATKFFRLLVQQ